MFGRLARHVLRHSRRWWLGIAVLTAICSLLAVNLGVNSDTLDLMPQDNPAVQAMHELDHDEGGIAFLTISVSGENQPDVDAFLVDLSPRVEALPEVRYAMWHIEPAIANRIMAMQLSVDELSTIRDRLKGALALGPMVANPFIAGQLLDLGQLTRKLAAEPSFSLTGSPNTGKLVVRPAGSHHDVKFARQLMTKVHAAIEAASPENHHVRITWIGGPYRHGLEDVDGIEHDLAWTSFAAIALISLALLVAYRDWRAVLVIMVPQVIGSIWTLGFAKIAVGSVNMFTSFAVAVLVGLGNDYAIVLYARYREERAGGKSVNDAVVASWDAAGPPSLTAALTTAAGFFALLVASFRGFQQLGIIIGVGVLLCFVCVLTVVPLMLKWLDPAPTGGLFPSTIDVPDRTTAPTYRWALPVLVVCGAITVLSSVMLPYIQFNFDLSSLRRVGMAYEDLEPEQQSLVRQSFTPLVVDYPDEASMTRDYDRVVKLINDGQFPEVTRALSIRTVLPPDAEARAVVLDQIAVQVRDPNMKYLPRPVQANLASLTSLAPGEHFALTKKDLPEALLSLLGADGGKHRLLLLPSGNMWDLRENETFAQAVQTHLPGRQMAGEYLIQAALYEMTQTDGPRIAIVALLLVTMLMAFDLRRVGATSWGMFVQIVGLIWAGGALVPLGLTFNLVNIVGIPICVGTGIEFAIFLMHRLKAEGPWGVKRAVLTSGLASVLCMITTMLGFLSLLFADNRGIRSLGLLVTAGDFVHAIAGFILLPAGAAYVYSRRAAARAAGSAPVA